MQIVVYLLFICFIIWLALTLLPIILPIVLIIVVVASIYIWNLKRKIVKHMDTYSEDISNVFQEDTTYQSYTNQNVHQEDIIDVEYSEREDRDE